MSTGPAHRASAWRPGPAAAPEPAGGLPLSVAFGAADEPAAAAPPAAAVLEAAVAELAWHAGGAWTWQSRAMNRPSRLLGEDARTVLEEAGERHRALRRAQAVVVAAAGAAEGRLAQAVEAIGTPDVDRELLGATSSSASTRLVQDLGRLAAGELTLADFVTRHGHLGAAAGRLDAPSWREDPAPVRALAAAYTGRPQPPVAPRAAAAARRLREPAGDDRTTAARVVAAQASGLAAQRATGRGALLRVVDVGRAAARGYGRWLTGQGALEAEQDVFLFTLQELRTLPATAMAGLAAARRGLNEGNGQTTATPLPVNPSGVVTAGVRLSGGGASAGVATGTVRVLDAPDARAVHQDTVLVCRRPDPGFTAVLPLGAAVVTSGRGVLGHTAIACRSLGLPCVVLGAEGGLLRDGMRVRVDGRAGSVDVLA